MRALRPLPYAAALAALILLSACAGTPRRRAHRQPPPPVPELAKAVVRTARRFLPEEDGHLKTPKDCSDFVDRVFRANGLRLPRTSRQMSRLGKRVPSSRDLRMGDLVFFAGSGGGSRVGHVGIYVNDGIFIHEPSPEEGVRMESLYNDYYRTRYLTARRVIN
jgi:cell wall-associated NlpC family hydrolase